MYRPTEQEVQQAMDVLKMDRLQAYRHLVERNRIQQQLKRQPMTAAQILGKSAVDA
jgi:hypothetical protein